MQKGIYRHWKGGKYEVLDIVKHSETLEEMVLYRHLDDDGGLWVRPKAMFEETNERDGKTMLRFIFQGEEKKNEADNSAPVFFYEHEYYTFSNFSSFAMEWNGKLWMTSEHVYHGEKFTDEQLKEQMRIARSADAVLRLSHQHRDAYRKDWEEVKLKIMKSILHAKVAQHPYVKKKLLDSGERPLIEDSWRDDFWGWGPNKDGHNHLGKLWMEVRSEIRNKLG